MGTDIGAAASGASAQADLVPRPIHGLAVPAGRRETALYEPA